VGESIIFNPDREWLLEDRERLLKENAALKVRLQKMREALEKYSKHSPNCEYLQNVVMLDRSTIIRGECTCGLAEALADSQRLEATDGET